MSDALWTRLAAPFAPSALTWHVIAVDEAGEEATVVARLRSEALAARLDEHCGVAGWSLSYAPYGGGAVGCTLEVSEVRKAAVVNALPGGAAVTAEHAFAAAAALLGMVAPADPSAQRVPYDAEAGVTLHDPEVPAAAADAESATAPALREADARARDLSDEGRRMIDRLVDRLKDEGQGQAASRLLVRFGGYGKDADAARELYGELRALLKRASDAEPEREVGP